MSTDMIEDDKDLPDVEALANEPEIAPQRKTVEDFAGMITASWQKSVTTILECAELCWLAWRQLSQSDFQKLIKMLPFNKATFTKLKNMGSDPRMREHADRLPPNWTIISDLQRLPAPAFAKALEQGVVSPRLQRAALKKWVIENGGAPARSRAPALSTLPFDFVAGVRVPFGYPDERQTELLQALDDMCKKFEVQLVSQQNAILARALGFMKAEAATIVRKERMRRRAEAGKHQKASSWPFDWNETDVAKARSHDDIKHMFQQLNMDIDYKRIAALAMERVAARLARAAEIALRDDVPKRTPEEIQAEMKEMFAKVPKPRYLRRRNRVTDFK
jgi:hypothetical protein